MPARRGGGGNGEAGGGAPLRVERFKLADIASGSNNVEARPHNVNTLTVTKGDGDAQFVGAFALASSDFALRTGFQFIRTHASVVAANQSSVCVELRKASDNSVLIELAGEGGLRANSPCDLDNTQFFALDEDTEVNVFVSRAGGNIALTDFYLEVTNAGGGQGKAGRDADPANDATARAAAAAAMAAAAAAQATADAALSKAGGTMTGKIVLDGAPTADLHPATKKYVDDNAGGNGGGGGAPSLMQEAFDGATAANANEQRLGDFLVENHANVVYLIKAGASIQFVAGNLLAAYRSASAVRIGGVDFYSNGSRHFLAKPTTANATAVRVWVVEDAQAFMEIAERFLPTISSIDAQTGTGEERRIFTAERVREAIIALGEKPGTVQVAEFIGADNNAKAFEYISPKRLSASAHTLVAIQVTKDGGTTWTGGVTTGSALRAARSGSPVTIDGIDFYATSGGAYYAKNQANAAYSVEVLACDISAAMQALVDYLAGDGLQRQIDILKNVTGDLHAAPAASTGWGAAANDTQGGMAVRSGGAFNEAQAKAAAYSRNPASPGGKWLAVRVPLATEPAQVRVRLLGTHGNTYRIALTSMHYLGAGTSWKYYGENLDLGGNVLQLTLELTGNAAHVGASTFKGVAAGGFDAAALATAIAGFSDQQKATLRAAMGSGKHRTPLPAGAVQILGVSGVDMSLPATLNSGDPVQVPAGADELHILVSETTANLKYDLQIDANDLRGVAAAASAWIAVFFDTYNPNQQGKSVGNSVGLLVKRLPAPAFTNDKDSLYLAVAGTPIAAVDVAEWVEYR